MIMQKSYWISLCLLLGLLLGGLYQNTLAQSQSGEKVVLVTLDGYRWQELFAGADALLIANEDYVSDSSSLKEKFWRNSPEARRRALMRQNFSFNEELSDT